MKRWKTLSLLTVGVLIVGFLIVGVWAFQTYWLYIPRLIDNIKHPISPARNVVWEEAPAAIRARDPRPNIVLIVADDLGFNGLSYRADPISSEDFGSTPHIDSIAQSGIAFGQAYSASGTSAPSRAGLMTGRYPTRSGFEFTPGPSIVFGMLTNEYFVEGRSFNPEHYSYPSGTIPDHNSLGMPADVLMLPEVSQQEGYRTLMIGKWHLGGAAGMRPDARGFDEFVGFMPGFALYSQPEDPNMVEAELEFDVMDRMFRAVGNFAVVDEEGHRFRPSEYMTDYLTAEALKAVEANRAPPFFLYLAYNAPHTPLTALQSDYDALGEIEGHRERVYAAMIRSLDRGVGAILEKLEERGLEENTIVLFTTDNGGDGNAGLPRVNIPLRGYKASFFEGGVRVPFFMKWPSAIPAAQVHAGSVTQMDIFPTLTQAADASLPESLELDGQDLLSDHHGPREIFWRNGQYRAYRKNDWKLQWLEKSQRIWLFDLANDPFERNDLAAAMPHKVEDLMADLRQIDQEQLLSAWLPQLEIPLSVDKTLEEPLQEDDEYIVFTN